MPAEGPWKDRFTSLDTLALAREVRGLVHGRVDKAFDDATPGGWFLAIRSASRGRFELRFVPGRFAALLPREGEIEHAESLEPFARELRRLLSGAVLAEVPDPAGERYLEIQFQRGGGAETFVLGVELFGTGNAVVAQGATLAAVAHPRSWKNRVVRVGASYERPPSRTNPWEIGTAELAQALSTSRTDLVSTLAARLSFGGPVAEELVARAGVEGARPAAEDSLRVAEALRPRVLELLAEVGEAPKGYLYARGGTPIDVEPYRSHRVAGKTEFEVQEFATFSEAADRFFSALRPRTVAPTVEDERIATLARLRKQQVDAVATLETEVGELRRRAELILANYADVERQIALARERTSGDSSTLEVELDGARIEVEVSASPRAAAQAIFEEMKRAQSKLSGARAALEDTERGLGAPRTPSTPQVRTKRPVGRRLWFEEYRWFVTSEGLLAIGGRDAGSNDRVVKRYLRKDDLYFHADIHGAPSVVLKHGSGGPAAGEASIRECAQWGLSFSKAWRAGLASGDAFWVTADQVDKAAATGEFVARGAWVIHGTKHVLHDLPLELAIGTIAYEGAERWLVAPPESLRARGGLRAVLSPGEERDRSSSEVELARFLGLSRNELQPLLPSGGLRFRRA
jgi:predicted ribosome quality control (RQC) complex YloA/Tae2 family protein